MENQSIELTLFYVLSVTVLLLVAIIVKLAIGSRKLQRSHDQKMLLMKQMMVHLLENQDAQSTKIRLSEELKDRLQQANRSLSNEIVAMMHDFIETLTQNDLLKK